MLSISGPCPAPTPRLPLLTCLPSVLQALKASRGAPFRLPVAQCSLEEWEQLVAAQGLVALAAEPDRGGAGGPGQQHAQQQRQQQEQRQVAAAGGLADTAARLAALRVCLCLGAEGQGVSPGVRQLCRTVSIPQAAGQMESLNAAAAGAALMFALSAGAAPLLAELAAVGEE